jgi:peptidyl-prolyl cis-trans isomerase SurA
MKHFVLLTAAAAALILAGCRKSPPANVAAEVNGRAITNAELDKTYKSQYPQAAQGSNKDQELTNKLELLNSMITSEIMLQRAEKLGLTAVDADVEAEFNKMKSPYTKEQFDQKLKERSLTVDDLKTQIRRETTLSKLINKEITSRITITDADVSSFFNENKSAFNHPEATVRIAQILVTPFPDSSVRNLKNDKAQNQQEAIKKIQDIAMRLSKGEDFSGLAQNYSEDPLTAPNGGDMGPVPESNLDKAGPELKKLVTSLDIGVPSRIIPGPDGLRILKVISREPAGQRELQDPRVQQEIRDTLLNRKDQMLKAAYYEVHRNNSKIQNYLAQSIIQ